MCKITLSYDENDALARQQLSVLLASGCFMVDDSSEEFPGLDYSDPGFYENSGDLPVLAEEKEYYTPEELRDILIKDMHEIYQMKDAV
jgi:hypothetical protein